MNNLRLIIKRFIPRLIWEIVKNIIKKKKKSKSYAEIINDSYQYFLNYDRDRFLNYSNILKRHDTSEKIISEIITVYHTIEKGLTMGDIRPGFGLDKLNYLIELCELHIKRFGIDNEMLLEAIGVIAEYDQFHETINYELDQNLQQRINKLLTTLTRLYITNQIHFTKESYFKDSLSGFDAFSNSRHSLRDFKENERLELIDIERAVELAQNTPSTCNRQSVRVHIIENKEVMNKILLLQNGNRGFGERADKLIILSSDLQCWDGINQRYGPYFDSGMYAMNLLYTLHFYKIAACPLNWYASVENDLKLREILDFPKNEVVTVVIVCGTIKDSFKIAKSKRRDYKNILKHYT